MARKKTTAQPTEATPPAAASVAQMRAQMRSRIQRAADTGDTQYWRSQPGALEQLHGSNFYENWEPPMTRRFVSPGISERAAAKAEDGVVFNDRRTRKTIACIGKTDGVLVLELLRAALAVYTTPLLEIQAFLDDNERAIAGRLGGTMLQTEIPEAPSGLPDGATFSLEPKYPKGAIGGSELVWRAPLLRNEYSGILHPKAALIDPLQSVEPPEPAALKAMAKMSRVQIVARPHRPGAMNWSDSVSASLVEAKKSKKAVMAATLRFDRTENIVGVRKVLRAAARIGLKKHAWLNEGQYVWLAIFARDKDLRIKRVVEPAAIGQVMS